VRDSLCPSQKIRGLARCS